MSQPESARKAYLRRQRHPHRDAGFGRGAGSGTALPIRRSAPREASSHPLLGANVTEIASRGHVTDTADIPRAQPTAPQSSEHKNETRSRRGALHPVPCQVMGPTGQRASAQTRRRAAACSRKNCAARTGFWRLLKVPLTGCYVEPPLATDDFPSSIPLELLRARCPRHRQTPGGRSRRQRPCRMTCPLPRPPFARRAGHYATSSLQVLLSTSALHFELCRVVPSSLSGHPPRPLALVSRRPEHRCNDNQTWPSPPPPAGPVPFAVRSPTSYTTPASPCLSGDEASVPCRLQSHSLSLIKVIVGEQCNELSPSLAVGPSPRTRFFLPQSPPGAPPAQTAPGSVHRGNPVSPAPPAECHPCRTVTEALTRLAADPCLMFPGDIPRPDGLEPDFRTTRPRAASTSGG
ncbi:MAG: hypothetical protein BJ554DRAFT_1947 [Olpidium bornovanus]|uniref:Uncharacterized protein n=1 Tax=Olpidium bornovanus TaxID=278681 RepID=A0A8H8DH13_9FUNG|nr:MAG: hypothetical protein BJ554DRAFT_1947 [Olpidium bornovanus]